MCGALMPFSFTPLPIQPLSSPWGSPDPPPQTSGLSGPACCYRPSSPALGAATLMTSAILPASSRGGQLPSSCPVLWGCRLGDSCPWCLSLLLSVSQQQKAALLKNNTALQSVSLRSKSE